MMGYADKVDLCIDHHGTNAMYAKQTYVDTHAAATAEIIFEIVKALGVRLNSLIADCLFTGVTTDTGAFRVFEHHIQYT